MTGTFLVAKHNGRAVATRVLKADTPMSRSKGLLGRAQLDAQEGLWIVIPCPMIHTFFMKFPIDAVFLNDKFRVVRIIENMKPWRLSPWVFAADSVLELKGGILSGTVKIGDTLDLRSA